MPRKDQNSSIQLTSPTKVLRWLRSNECPTGGIVSYDDAVVGSPGLTAALLSTLFRNGEQDMASRCAQWLIDTQDLDGSYPVRETHSNRFLETVLVLRGLTAVRQMHSMVEKTVRRAGGYIFRSLNRFSDENSVFDSQFSAIEECMGLGALSAANKLLNVSDFQKLIESRIGKLSVYETQPQAPLDTITELLDALIDLNQVQLARQILKELDNYQDNSGLIPVRPRAHWVSTAGITHLALCWQRVGQHDRLESVVKWLEQRQRPTGGFHAGYGWRAPFEFRKESAWTAKWYLDAHYFRVLHFMEREVTASYIPKEDGRFVALMNLIRPGDNVLEVGCGRGRYLRAIRSTFPDVRCTGADIVPSLLANIPPEISTIEASMEAVPSPDNSFDVVFSVEALEHSANFQAAIREMSRIAKPGGWLAVIDKERRQWGKLECPSWERWPAADELALIFKEYCDEVHYQPVGYDGRPPDGLMMIWQGRKRGSVNTAANSVPARPVQ